MDSQKPAYWKVQDQSLFEHMLMNSNTYALATEEEVAPFQLAEHIKELLQETDDFSRKLVIVSYIRYPLREAGL